MRKTLNQIYITPAWNDYVKGTHTEARHCYVLWCDMGKLKNGPICELIQKLGYTLNNTKTWIEQIPLQNPSMLQIQ